jgi:hypothetical protein
MDFVRQAIHRLPAAQRQAVELAYYHGFTQKQGGERARDSREHGQVPVEIDAGEAA